MTKKLGWFVVAGADLSDYTEQEQVNLLGGKGAGLQFMKANGINVPPFLTIPTDVHAMYVADPKGTIKSLKEQIDPICNYFIDQFGYMPLLSVRSGARVSAPGMMDTVLNVGLDSVTYPFWTKQIGTKCAANCQDRLTEMYGTTVLGKTKEECKLPDVPKAKVQLLKCIEAVLKSWDSERCKIYRKMNNIPDDWGTAVTVQAMVFGNYNDNSCSGVVFTRNPDTGLAAFTGEYLPNAQGEEVVAGTATPLPLVEMNNWNHMVYEELTATLLKLEELKRDMQDVEFTVQNGKLYILQTRNAKRSAMAAIKVAVDMHKEGVLTVDEVIGRIKARDFDLAQLPIIDPKGNNVALYTGLPACSGVATGKVVKTAQAAIDCKEPCILVTEETTPDDIGGMIAAKGVLTMTGGATCHAAVVARGMNRPCVVGLSVDIAEFAEGEVISIDGATGRVFKGEVALIKSADSAEVDALLEMLWTKAAVSRINGKSATYITVGDTVLMPPQDRIKEVVSRVAKTSGTVYLDFTEASLSPMENNFYDCFKPDTSTAKAQNFVTDSFVNQVLNELTKNGGKKVKELILVGAEAKGFHSLTTVGTLEGLILATGEVVMEPGCATVNKDALIKLLALKGKEVSFLSVGVAKEGQKSFISEPQLIATFLK